METRKTREGWLSGIFREKFPEDGSEVRSRSDESSTMCEEGDDAPITTAVPEMTLEAEEGDMSENDTMVEVVEDCSSDTMGTDNLQLKFIIPDEGEEDLLGEQEMNLDDDLAPRIRKPSKHEFFRLGIHSFSANLLPHKAHAEAMDEELLFVTKELRGKIAKDLQRVKFFLCYSCTSGRFFIWAVKMSDTDWYRSLEVLFRKPEEFFRENIVRIRADKELGRYRIFAKPDDLQE